MGVIERRQGFMLLAFLMVMMLATKSSGNCKFDAIFNFGDSNSDTGGFWAAFPAQGPPFGMTYFGRPVGRATDGRLIIYFLAQGLGLPFLSPYLQSIGSDYRHGVNFATLASTVLLPNTSQFVTGVSPFSLAIQLSQMKQFKVDVEQRQSSTYKKVPQPDIFGKSLYTFYIGQNDFTGNIASFDSVKKYLPQVVSQIASTIEEIYLLGGRTFFVLNLAPVGCYPAILAQIPHNAADIDSFRCLISYNNAVIDYNRMLKAEVSKTRQDIRDAHVILVDTHAILLKLFQQPSSHGLKYGTKACCGYGGGAYNFDPRVYCGNMKTIKGRNLTARACSDPYNYVSFDGIHATEAANKVVAQGILGGAYFDPPFEFCHIHPIG